MASVEYRHLGERNSWDTTEICTNDPEEIGKYLSGFPPYTRVWISAYGTVWLYQGRRKIGSGELAHVSLTDNTEYARLNSKEVNAHVAREMEVFRNPETGELDIEYFCVRTKEALEDDGDIDF